MHRQSSQKVNWERLESCPYDALYTINVEVARYIWVTIICSNNLKKPEYQDIIKLF